MTNKKGNKLRVMVDLCATMIHHGHVRLIKKAKTHFINHEVVVVIGLTTDDEIKIYKGYHPELCYEERKEVLEALKDVDDVVPAPWYITNEILETYNIDFLVHGSDNQNEVEDVIVFPKTNGISSHKLREYALHSIVQKRNTNKIMFTPGPSNMSYLNMLDLKGVFGRGDNEYSHIEEQVLNSVLKLTGHDNIVRFQGGGTTAIDVATSNIVFGRILIIDAGYYSRRIEGIISRKLEELPNTSFKVINYQDIDKELAIDDTYDWVVTAYAETADAFLCDINLLRKLADSKQAKLFLDATASINLESDHHLADVCSFSSCKGLGGLTGAAFVTYKSSVYVPKRRGNVPFTMDLETHINKLYTGPYHAICSLYSISKDFNSISENVKKSKALFLKKYKDRLVRPVNQQPLISTLINANNVGSNKNVVLYQPRTSPAGTAVICHFGDMFTSENNIGDIYDALTIQ